MKILSILIIFLFNLLLPVNVSPIYAIDDEVSYTGVNTNIYGDDSHQGEQRGLFRLDSHLLIMEQILHKHI